MVYWLWKKRFRTHLLHFMMVQILHSYWENSLNVHVNCFCLYRLHVDYIISTVRLESIYEENVSSVQDFLDVLRLLRKDFLLWRHFLLFSFHFFDYTGVLVFISFAAAVVVILILLSAFFFSSPSSSSLFYISSCLFFFFLSSFSLLLFFWFLIFPSSSPSSKPTVVFVDDYEI